MSSSTQIRRKQTRAVFVGLVSAALAATSFALVQVPAQAGTTITSIPKIDAVDTTPRVVDDGVVSNAGVREFRQVGTTMYAGGEINTVRDAANTATYTRRNLFSFDANTGTVSGWAPVVDGPVYAMEPSADGRYLYIGGDFKTFDGQSVPHLVKYDLQAGALDLSFRSKVTNAAAITDLQIVGGRLFVAGTFTGGIAALDPTTGAQTTYLDSVQATGAESGYTNRIYRFAVNPAGDRMVVIGSFTAVGGQPRQQAAMVQLGTTATVSPWSSTRWNEDCASVLQWYTRDVDWSPDGTFFAIANSGGPAPGTTKLCDTITRWNPVDAANQQPVWINYSGGDTFHSVAVTNLAVFAGGHFRWLDNPDGRDTKVGAAVNRLGLGAVNRDTGKALSWNPSKSVEGGNGAFDLYFTSSGLWVGHFELRLGTGPTGKELHEGLGLLPF